VPNLNTTQSESKQDLAHAALLAAFNNFFSVASFYPIDHTKCHSALAEMRQLLGKVVGPNAFLSLEPHEGGIRLQGVFLDKSCPSSETVFSLLEALGVARFKIHSAAPLEELHLMVRTINTLKLESDSAQEFHSMDFSRLPKSVQIQQRKFDWGPAGTEGQTDPDGNSTSPLKNLLGHLGHLNWNNAQKQEFQHRMKFLLARIAELARSDTEQNQNPAGPTKPSQEEVLAIGTTALQQAIVLLSGDDAPQDVDQLFKHAAEALAYTADSTAVSLMFEVFNDVSEMQRKEQEKFANPEWGKDTSEYQESVSSLSTKVLQLAAQASLPEINVQETSTEHMSICFHLLIKDSDDSLKEKLHFEVESYFAPPLGLGRQEEAEKLVAAMVQSGDRKPIDAAMPLLLNSMLRGSSERFANFLKDLLPATNPENLGLAWPHLVGLLLQPKPPQNPSVLDILGESISALPAERMATETHRLDFIPVILSGEMGTALVQLPLDKTRSTLKALLEGRQSKQVGQQLHNRWKVKPPSILAALLIRILGPYENGHKSIYLGLLNDDGKFSHTEEFHSETEMLIHSALMGLAGPDRKKSWVIKAIEELGRMGGPNSRKVLEDIVIQKKWFVFKAWPEDCRNSATKALQKLSRHPTGKRAPVQEGEEQ
jgi:hypothetical protein